MSTNAVFELHPGITMKGQLSMAKDIVLTGKFEGDLQTLGCLRVASGGVVTGSIEAGALILEPGNQVEAKDHGGGSAPEKDFNSARGSSQGRQRQVDRQVEETEGNGAGP